MRNFIFVAANLAIVCLVFAICSLANYLFDLHIAFKGARLPSNPIFVLVLFVIAGAFYAAAYFVKRKSENQRADEA